MMANCAKILLFLAVVISKSGNHALEVSIQTDNSLPVIGEDFTLGCTFTPQLHSRRVTWENGDSIVLFSQACWLFPDCVETVPSKFSLLADLSSGNLTIQNLTKYDSNSYQCTVSSEFAAETLGSSHVQVTTLLPAPPNRLFISDDNVQDGYLNDAQVNVTYGVLHTITCEAQGARPPAVLEWRIPDDVIVILHDQSDVVQGNSYVSLKAATITPSRNDQGKNLLCVASHPDLQNHLQNSIYLNVQVLPTNMVLSSAGDTEEYETDNEPKVINIQEETVVTLTCESIGSLPSAALSWALGNKSISENISSSVHRNVLDGSLYDTKSTIKIHPTRMVHGELIMCFISLGSFNGRREAILMVYGRPDVVTLASPENLYDGTQTTVYCNTVNGYPVPFIHWHLGSRNITEQSHLHVFVNEDNRYDVNSTLTFTPMRIDHGQRLLCQVLQQTSRSLESRNASITLNISYSPTIIGFSVHRNVSRPNASRESLTLTCVSDANPPAYIFKWFRNGQILDTDNFPMFSSSVVHEGETITKSILTLQSEIVTFRTPFTCMSITSLGNESAVIDIFPLPVPPPRLIIDRNYTTSSSMLVGWQPGFDGGLRQTFSLKLCTNDTQEDEERCSVVSNLTDTYFELKGLKPFTWYRLVLWAINSAGESGALETVASTSPLSPLDYGMNITLNRLTGVLTFSETNTEHSLEETCFFIFGNTRPDCLSIEKCIEPGSEVKVDQDVEYLVLTSGRGLCSKPDRPTDEEFQTITDEEFQTITDEEFQTITVIDPTTKGESSVTGYVITAGVLAFTVVMFAAVGVICLVKKMSARNMILTSVGTIPPIPMSDPTNKQMDQGDNAEIAQEHPPRDSKSTTSYSMDLKPIPRTDNDTTTSDYMDLKPIPRADNDTTTSYYMDLKPVPRTNKDTTTSYYMDLKPIPRTDNDTTTSDYMDLKPIPRTDNGTTTSDYMDLKPIPRTDNDDFVSPSFTRTESEAVYVNKDMPEEKALQNDPDNHNYVSPSITRKEFETVFVKTDMK